MIDTTKPTYRVHKIQRNVAKYDTTRSFEVPMWNECKFWLELYDSDYVVEEFSYNGQVFVGDTLYGLHEDTDSAVTSNVGESNE